MALIKKLLVTGVIVSVAAASGFAWWTKQALPVPGAPIEFSINPGSGVAASAQQMAVLEAVADREHLLYGSDYPWTPADLAGRLLGGLDQVAGDGWRGRTTRNAERLLTRGRSAA